MTGSSVLDVAIGIIFIYLLFGVIVTIINEATSSLLQKRGKNLLEGIKNLLNDPRFNGLAHQVYNHGLIDGVSQNATRNDKKNRLPSYISSTSFSLAMVDILTSRGALAAANSNLLTLAETACEKYWEAQMNKLDEAALQPLLQDKQQTAANLQAEADAAKLALATAQANAGTAAGTSNPQQYLYAAQLRYDRASAALKILAAREDAMRSASDPKSLAKICAAADSAESALALGRVLAQGDHDPLGTIEHAIANLPPGHTKESLAVLLEKTRRELKEGEHALETLRKNLETWFNQSMDRVSGWYKRWSEKISLLLAAILVIVCNVDSLQLAQRLMNDRALREALVAAATETAATAPASGDLKLSAALTADTPETTASTTPNEATSANGAVAGQLSQATQDKTLQFLTSYPELPFGWNGHSLFQWQNWQTDFATQLWLLISKCIGLTISIFAISLGAPFWFDLLVKFVHLRSAGQRPERQPS